MTLHRFFLPAEAMRGETVAFPPDAARQIARVLRLRPGDQVIALDGTGEESIVALVSTGREVTGRIMERRPNEREPKTRLTLYAGMPKGTKLETVLQKGTEIGVARFVPVLTSRAVAGEPTAGRYERWETIVREAAEQSGRGVLPSVERAMSLQDALRDAAARGPLVVLWEDKHAARLRDLDLPGSGEVGLLAGPEGGLSAEEVEQARQVGARVVTLGPRILRAETACIAGAALLLAHLGDLG